jgi:thiamine-phosphate pyrophosphorylase
MTDPSGAPEDGAQPRLYLIAPADLPAAQLRAALEAGDVAAVLLRDATAASGPLVRPAQERGAAVLVENDAALAKALGADGVHLGPGGRVKATRRQLADDAIVGAYCGRSRHTAMLAGEAGADYVAFAGREESETAPAEPGILEWWQTMMELPCVAMGPIPLADVRALAEAGADFVALEEAVWAHPDGPAAAVHEANRRLAEARR